MKDEIAILGAGIIGSLTAYYLAKAGKIVRIFDELPQNSLQRASAVAAGMLAPYSERDTAVAEITQPGLRSIARWKTLIDEIGSGIFFQQTGTLVVSHPGDEGLIERLRARLFHHEGYEILSEQRLRNLEPELDRRFTTALFFAAEAQIDAPAILARLHEWLASEASPVVWESSLKSLSPCSHVVDCRGWKAQDVFSELRGVRGERFLVEAPGVHLNHPIRVMHPRYPLYLLPRQQSQFIIGATVIESQSLLPVSLRSSLELLSGAYAIHSGLGEARILESRVGIRPALPHALPEIRSHFPILRANGLYRHGYLLGPEIAQAVTELITTGSTQCPFYVENR